MKLHHTILVLACILGASLHTSPALAQFQEPSRNYSVFSRGAERHSPHYYTVRNILRNHRTLQPASSSTGPGLRSGSSIATSDVELESEVVFEHGAYEFHANLQGSVFKVRLRKVDGEWVLEVRDEFDDTLLGTYALKR